MTVILMLSMFVIFLTIDCLMGKGKVTATESETGTPAAQSSPRLLPTIVGGFELPENWRCHQGHTWRCGNARRLYAWD